MGAPQTLPADFQGWDKAAPAAPPDTLPANFNQWDNNHTPQGASPGFWDRVKEAIKPRKYSEESGFAAKQKGQPEGLPGVSEGAGLAGGLAEWDKASFGEIGGGVGDILQGDVSKGLHRIFTGTGHALTPALALTLPGTIGLSALPRTALTVGGGLAGGAAASTAAESLGATPEQAQVASDVGNVVGGVGANRLASAVSSGVSKARALWDLIPEETQKSIARKAISMVPGAKTVSTGLDIKNDISNVLDALRKVNPTAPSVAAAEPEASKITPQGWYYLGRMQEIAKGIEEEEAAAAKPKNITAAKAANLTKPVVPPASTNDLTPLLQEMLDRANFAKGRLSDLAVTPQATLSTPSARIMSAIEQEGGNVVGVAKLAKAAGVSVPEAKSIVANLQKTGRIDIHVGRQAGEAQESIYGAQLKRPQ